MTTTAAGYIIRVPSDRRAVLLSALEHEDYYSYRSTPSIAEPVPHFDHSRNAQLVVFASFENDMITHVADGKRGRMAGTGLVRLNLYDLTPLLRPIKFDELMAGVDTRVRSRLDRIINVGGRIPPKTFEAVVRRIVELDESTADRLARFTPQRREALRRLSVRERFNLGFQKDTVGLALQIGGFSRNELLTWQPTDGYPRSFLDGLPSVKVREDAMLVRDFSVFPGFELLDETTNYASRVFENTSDPSVRMTIVMANRLPLEQQTGADLIYFNEAYQSFVMVQYKAMETGTHRAEFRWQDGDQFTREIKRMKHLFGKLQSVPHGSDPDSFRFSENPFFLKFCPRVVFDPDNSGLFNGIYVPLDLWNRLQKSGRLVGLKGGNIVTSKNVGRRINNTDFARLVAGSWVGTSIEQSTILAPIIRSVVSRGRTVTFAMKH